MTEVARVPESTEKMKESATELADALNLLAQGKRNMVCGEVPQAVNQLQEACRILAKKYGETANECGEAYLCYGKALLDMSRMESGVLGNALKGIEEEEESDEKSSEDKSSENSDQVEDPEKTPVEEREKISDQVIDAMLETDDELKDRLKKDGKEDEQKKDENDANGVEDKDEKEEKSKGKIEMNGESASAKEAKDKDEEMETDEKKDAESEELNTEEEGEEGDEEGEEVEGEEVEGEEVEGEEVEGEEVEGEEVEGEEGKTEDEEGEEKKKEDEEDVTNLQLAWEVLELAKIIYKRDSSKENKLKLAEAFLKLGEVGLETDQYDQAISDFNECFKIQKSVLDGDDRLLAETKYQLGLANTNAYKYTEAIESYRAAADVIKKKMESLEKIVEKADKESKGKGPADPEDPVVKARKEIDELKEIIPDIEQKILDVEEESKNSDITKAMIKDAVAAKQDGASSSAFQSSSSKESGSTSQASDITHLVRKKRKSDDGKEMLDDAKKSKVSESGDS